MNRRSDTPAYEAAPKRPRLLRLFGRKPPAPVDPPRCPEKFEALEWLGEGGFAVTWRARVLDRDLREKFGTDIVALKVPKKDWTDTQIFKEIVIMEKVAQRVLTGEAKNIVPYLGAGACHDRVVIAMQYMPDGSLRQRLEATKPQRRLPPDQAVAVTAGILNGLDAIHREGICHRDIKPPNILFAGEEPHLCDLGVARILAADQLASTVCGTDGYMAPEVHAGKATFTADIWSVGVVLYEMLTGNKPRSRKAGGGAWGLDLVPPAELCVDISPRLNALVIRALRRDPADRFTSAAEMRSALLELDAGEPTRIVERFARSPADATALRLLGQESVLRQDYPAAIKAFERGLQLKEDDAALHWELALVLRDLQRLPEARHHLQRALAFGEPALRRSAEQLLVLLE